MRFLHLGCADDIREGFDNLDVSINGWRFEDGLPYTNASVDGITISHALMYVAPPDMPAVMRDFYRVLRPGGVVRITEDDCETRTSPRYLEPWPGARFLTGPASICGLLVEAGFHPIECEHDETHSFNKAMLITHRERKVPKYVFYIEGVKPCLT